MSASFPSQRVQLGKLVRQSRLAAGMNQTELAESIGCRQEKISKIETGYSKPGHDDLRRIVEVLRIDPDRAAEMRRLLDIGGLSGYRRGVPEWFQRYFGDEPHANEVRAWHSERIPAWLEAESYTLAMFAPESPEEIADHLRLREERRALFSSPSPPQYHVVFSESSFRRSPGGASVAIDQIRHLLGLGAEHDWLHIRVIPFDVPMPYSANDFTLMSMGKSDYVYVEHLKGALYLDKPEDRHNYEEYWKDVDRRALTEQASREFLEQLVTELHDRMSR